jgi:hypothetical protein
MFPGLIAVYPYNFRHTYASRYICCLRLCPCVIYEHDLHYQRITPPSPIPTPIHQAHNTCLRPSSFPHTSIVLESSYLGISFQTYDRQLQALARQWPQETCRTRFLVCIVGIFVFIISCLGSACFQCYFYDSDIGGFHYGPGHPSVLFLNFMTIRGFTRGIWEC